MHTKYKPVARRGRRRGQGATLAQSSVALLLAVATQRISHAQGESADYPQLEASQNAANAKAGERHVPARTLPVPTNVSKALQAAIAAPYPVPLWTGRHANNAQAWKSVVAEVDAKRNAAMPQLRRDLGVKQEAGILNDVKVFELTPDTLSDANRDRIVLQIHGGGYVYNAGEAGTFEGVLVAAYGGFKVISVDYRMPPDHPYPAAVDDTFAVYKALVAQYGNKKIAVYGTSAGGALALALILKAKQEGVPLPAAIAPNTPWADLTEEGGGDSMQTNEWVDGALVSSRGYLYESARAYVGGADREDPFISPLRGDFSGFPPAIVATGTRDLFLSLSALTHRKLRQAGVEAELLVFEAQSHAQFLVPGSPETREMFNEVTRFFTRHLQ